MFAPPNPADRVGTFVAPFEDRMLLAFEALVIDRERMGMWSPQTAVEVVDLYAVSFADFGEMIEVIVPAAESTFE